MPMDSSCNAVCQDWSYLLGISHSLMTTRSCLYAFKIRQTAVGTSVAVPLMVALLQQHFPRVSVELEMLNGGPLIITCTILGVPHYKYSIMGPKTLFYLLRPLYFRTL